MIRFRAPRPAAWIVGAVFLAGPAAAAPSTVLAPEVDAASFPAATGSLTRVYLRLPVPEGETGKFLMEVTVNPSDAPARSHQWVLPEDGEQADPDGALRRTLEMALPPGKLDLRVHVQAVESGNEGEGRRQVEVPGFDPAFAVSDPVFGIRGGAPSGPDSAAVFLSEPSRRLAAAKRPLVEIGLRDTLGAGAGSTYRIRYQIRDARGRKQKEVDVRRARTGGEATARVPLSLDGLASGAYTLRLTAELSGRKVARERVFQVMAPPGPLRDPRELRTVLGYIATNQEIRTLENTRDADLPAFWKRFWARRDPDRSTPVNEAEVEFLQRVAQATRSFGGMEPGWDTDRGRIYIQIGPPDRVQELPAWDNSQRPTRIWYYYARDLTYVFEDVDGFGHYRLVRNRN